MQMDKLSFWQKTLYWLLLGFLLAVSVLLLFDNLGVPDIQRADEAQHGINAYEMLQSGNFLVHTSGGEVDYWNLKPPLSFYGIMLGYQLFGFTTFGLRFYSAASMFGLMVILALWMKKRYGRIASLVSQLFLMACGIIYGEHFARFGDADSLYVLFYTLSMLCMLQSPGNIRWLYGSAIGFGLAFMAKSWHAALIPITCFIFVCVNGQIRKIKWQQYLLLIFFGLLPVAPWAIARFQYDGLTFFKSMLGTDVFTRATTVLEDHSGGWLYYVRYLLSEPTVVLAVLSGMCVIVWKIRRRSRLTNDQLGLILWFSVPVLFFSLCVSKLQWYVFPCVIALAVAMGILLKKLFEAFSHAQRKVRITSIVSFGLCIVLLGSFAAVNLHTVSSVYCADLFDKLFFSTFVRERDSGKHVYIQYESENQYRKIDNTVWLRDELLSAKLSGDMICMAGGTAAFVADPEPAYLIAHDIGLEEDLLQDYQLAMVWPPLRVYKNHD